MDHNLLEIITELSGLSNYRSWINSNKPKLGIIKRATQFLPPKSGLRQRLWHLTNNIDSLVMCEHCNTKSVTWNDTKHCYRMFCSNGCVHKGGNLLDKRKRTCVDKYGVDNYFKMIDQVMVDRIKVLGVPHALQSEKIQAKLQQTNLRKYGTEWNISSKQSQLKKQQTCITKYGADHAMKSLQTWLKIVNPNLSTTEKERVYSLLHDRDFLISEHHTKKQPIQPIANTLGINPSVLRLYYLDHGIELKRFNVSIMETQLSDWLRELGVQVISNDRSIITPYELDIVLPEHNVAIECNGILWHSELHGKNNQYHLMKTTMCANRDIQLIHVRQDQWVLQPEVVKSRIRAKLGLSKTKIYGRKTTIVEVSSKEASTFLFNNHIQQQCKSSFKYGLMHDGELVAIMTFGKSRFSKKYEYELLRYCSKINHTVVGGASKLFKHFITQINPDSIVSYAGLSWNTGNMYSQLEFTFSHMSPPSYSYFHTSDCLAIFDRIQFQKHKLQNQLDVFDPALTEWENMINNGYDRIWDCGNSVWIWKRKQSMQ